MKFSLSKTVKQGVRQFIEHPQLWLTVAVTIAIFSSYIYVANRFINIASEAQDELVNVRVGALHDAFAPLAGVLYEEPELLRAQIQDISALNPTITNFFVAERAGQTSNRWSVVVALDPRLENTDLIGYDISLALSEANPGNSFTVEEVRDGERFFRTSRAIVDTSGDVRGIAITRQAMSAADKKIGDNIRKSVIILVLILLFLLLLFFKHARIIDYTVLYKKLKEVDTMKDDFVSMASHELRTPLTSIRGYADILKGSGEVKSEQGLKSLTRIDISARELDRLIADILDVSRIEQGRMQFNMQEINSTGIVAKVVDTLRVQAEAKGLELELNLEPEARISADPDRLRQIAVNLIGNAIKYTPEGKITVSSKVKDGMVSIRISDTGLGMSSEEQKELFAKFWRASDKEVRKQTGTGLGLWITKQMVEQMDGSIAVESIKGVGSHFIVTFPLV